MMFTAPLCSKRGITSQNVLEQSAETFQQIRVKFSTSALKKKPTTAADALLPLSLSLSLLPPGEYEFVEVVVAPRQDVPLRDVRLDAHRVALTLNVHLDTVQQVFDGGDGFPGSEGHHRLLIRLQAVDGVVIETQILLRSQYADHDGGVAGGDGLCSGDTDQHLEVKSTSMLIN